MDIGCFVLLGFCRDLNPNPSQNGPPKPLKMGVPPKWVDCLCFAAPGNNPDLGSHPSKGILWHVWGNNSQQLDLVRTWHPFVAHPSNPATQPTIFAATPQTLAGPDDRRRGAGPADSDEEVRLLSARRTKCRRKCGNLSPVDPSPKQATKGKYKPH